MTQQTKSSGPAISPAFMSYGISPLIVLLCFLLPGCGRTQELTSSWNNNAVTIDGNSNEWGSGLVNLKDTKVYFGIRNDDDNIYLCLTSPDPQFHRQLIGMGLSVWFESEDGKRMGILYPIGMMQQARQPSFDQDVAGDPEDREHLTEEALRDLEILGPKKDDRNLFSIVQAPGISVKVGNLQGSAVYELKVPLTKSQEHPYAIEAAGKSIVKIEIATGKPPSRLRSSESGGEEMRGGGRRDRGFGGGMQEGGMGRGGEQSGGPSSRWSRPKPLDVSLKVQIADHHSELSR